MTVQLGPYTLGPDGENVGIYTGDARELASAIPNESVDLIFTDPIYQNIDDYRWLTETAVRVLSDGGQLLVYQAHKWLPETMAALSSLSFVWMLGEQMAGAQARYWPLLMFVGWRPLLWYSKGTPRPFNRMGPDFCTATKTEGKNHPWHKRTGHIQRWIAQLSNAGDICVGPFTGGGTVPAVCKMLGRQWLAFEIEPGTAEDARQRVRQTQPPLPGLTEQIQQIEMESLRGE